MTFIEIFKVDNVRLIQRTQKYCKVYSIPNLVMVVLVFGPDSVDSGYFLSLCSGVCPGVTQGTIYGAVD